LAVLLPASCCGAGGFRDERPGETGCPSLVRGKNIELATGLEPGGDRATCASMPHRIDYDRNLAVLRLPRRCVDHPDWVRLVVESYWLDHSRSVIDNPHNREPKPDGVAINLLLLDQPFAIEETSPEVRAVLKTLSDRISAAMEKPIRPEAPTR
jgi:hypothetical protein